VIIDVIPVRVVEPPADEIVDVVAVRHGFVTAVWTVDMAGLALCATRGVAAIGIPLGDLDPVLLDAAGFLVQQSAMVEIVDMVAVPHGGAAMRIP
jgi:hypothetical protein